MKESDWQLAKAIARELVDRETDVNEFQKAISYARIQAAVPDGNVGEKFFALLEAMLRDGRYLVRSGRTMDYYRNLQLVCGQYLKEYRKAAGDDGNRLVEILGWAARFMRYYNTEVGEDEMIARQRTAEPKQPRQQVEPSRTAPAKPLQSATSTLVNPQPKPSAPPRNETKREKVALIAAPKNGKAQVRTSQGEQIACINIPAYPSAKAGDVCSADVIREGGRAVKAMFKGWSQAEPNDAKPGGKEIETANSQLAGGKNMITWASAFLSHNSKDKPLVEAVARELGRRGVLAWLDKDELHPGLTLSRALADAVKRQTMLLLFLSPASVNAPWVDDEMEIAFRAEEESGGESVVIPVCLGNALDLVKANQRLRARLLHATGDRINRIYIQPRQFADIETAAREIAVQVARTIFNRLNVRQSRDVLVYVDQRGNGRRCGEPEDIPPNLRRDIDTVGLLFRTDRGVRSQGETLHGQQWIETSKAMEEGLDEALGTPRWVDAKRIYVAGNAQSGFFYLIGRHFNRNTSARLLCTNTDQRIFTNQSQPPGAMQLQGGNANCESAHPDVIPLVASAKHESISLLLAPEKFVAPVQHYREAKYDSTPLVWVESGWFTDSDQAMDYITNVVALLTRLRREHRVQTVCLYNALPIHIVPLMAANLLHEVDNVVFMEYRRDLQGQQPNVAETYVALKL
jgi:hypothetical protein